MNIPIGRGIALMVGMLLAMNVGAAGPGAAAAKTAAAKKAPLATQTVSSWIDEITVNGFLSTSYSYNFNRPPSRTNLFRVFDFDDNSFKLDVFELVLQKPVAKP